MNILRQASLVEQVEALQERVKYLEALIGRDTHLPRAWGLSPLEERSCRISTNTGLRRKNN